MLLEFASVLGITYTFSPNFLLAQILRDVAMSPFKEPLDLSNVRAIISGGEAVPIGTAVAFTDLVERFGATRDVLRGGFGMSETGAGCIYDTRDVPRMILAGKQKYLSLGTCCNGVKMRIASPSTGKLCSRGEAGHLQITGSSVFTGYYGNERATKDSFTTECPVSA
jgi:acyl-CoA synthetase (AMP-forming)/AMP-acid ligase II